MMDQTARDALWQEVMTTAAKGADAKRGGSAEAMEAILNAAKWYGLGCGYSPEEFDAALIALLQDYEIAWRKKQELCPPQERD